MVTSILGVKSNSWGLLLSRQALPKCCDSIESLMAAVVRIRRTGLSVSTVNVFLYWYDVCIVNHNLTRSEPLNELKKSVDKFAEERNIYHGSR